MSSIPQNHFDENNLIDCVQRFFSKHHVGRLLARCNGMKEKGVSQYTLIKKYGISPAQITRLKRNESVSTHTIEMFCKILDCNVGDIMEYIKDSE